MRISEFMSVAAVQQQLLASSHGDPVYIGPYLSRLSQALAASMTDDSRPISLEVQAEDGGTASSAEAVSIGLIVTELVINAFKHAFVGNEAAGLVVVAYEAAETSWRLTVSDNGIGTPEGQLDSDKPRPGLGTIIVAALAKQLDARVEVTRSRRGTTVSITHGTSDRALASARGRRDRLAAKVKRHPTTRRRFGIALSLPACLATVDEPAGTFAGVVPIIIATAAPPDARQQDLDGTFARREMTAPALIAVRRRSCAASQIPMVCGRHVDVHLPAQR